MDVLRSDGEPYHNNDRVEYYQRLRRESVKFVLHGHRLTLDETVVGT